MHGLGVLHCIIVQVSLALCRWWLQLCCHHQVLAPVLLPLLAGSTQCGGLANLQLNCQ